METGTSGGDLEAGFGAMVAICGECELELVAAEGVEGVAECEDVVLAGLCLCQGCLDDLAVVGFDRCDVAGRDESFGYVSKRQFVF